MFTNVLRTFIGPAAGYLVLLVGVSFAAGGEGARLPRPMNPARPDPELIPPGLGDGASRSLPASASAKGSLLIFPHVEIRWDVNGDLYTDTFINLTNEYEQPVELFFLYVRENCTDIDVHTNLTRNQPAYWSAASGHPGPDNDAMPPFGTIGDALVDSNGEHYLRGYVVVFAVNTAGEQIRWNHLLGAATGVDYRHGTVWEYGAYAFRANNVMHGEVVGTPGELLLDGEHYDQGYNQLTLDFYRPGCVAFLGGVVPAAVQVVARDTALSLVMLDMDFRREAVGGPYSTLVVFDTWDQNETGLTGDAVCLRKWAGWTLTQLGGHFATIQTDRAYSRMDGIEYDGCDIWNQPPGGNAYLEVESRDSALLGVGMKLIDFLDVDSLPIDYDRASTILRGQGRESASILYEVPEGAEEKALDEMGGMLEG